MTTVDDLWYLGDEARAAAERTYHRLADEHEAYLEFTTRRRVSRRRFRTVAERTRENGLPYGAHVLAYRPDGRLLLVWHEAVELWVLPGGEVDGEESFRAAARRELAEEAGVDAPIDGLGCLARVEFACDGHETWGVLPLYEAPAPDETPEADDPDGEVTAARWFTDLPEDARDREQLRRWRRERLGE